MLREVTSRSRVLNKHGGGVNNLPTPPPNQYANDLDLYAYYILNINMALIDVQNM